MPDPHEPQERLHRFRSDADEEAWLLALNEHLAEADLPADGRPGADPSQLPLIYIVGAPRSGTTVLSQVMSRCLAVGYVDNLVARFWRRPSVGIRLSRILLGEHGREGITFESEHGTTRGIAGPHEFGYFWRYWLQLDGQPTHHLSAEALRALDAPGLRHAIEREVLASFGLPVVFKNVICGFQASALTDVHPRSLFVHIVRDTGATCASILKSRLDRYGTYASWWSLKPSTFAEIAAIADPCAQVVRQVGDCRAEIETALGRPGVHALTLRYEDLCRDPRTVLREITGALAVIGSRVEILDGVPTSLTPSPGPQLLPTLDAALRAALARSAAKG